MQQLCLFAHYKIYIQNECLGSCRSDSQIYFGHRTSKLRPGYLKRFRLLASIDFKSIEINERTLNTFEVLDHSELQAIIFITIPAMPITGIHKKHHRREIPCLDWTSLDNLEGKLDLGGWFPVKSSNVSISCFVFKTGITR